eukprot:5337551-Prymnesium_polylepis.1
MKQQLGALGYSAAEVSRLDPARAAAIIQHSIPRPPQGVPASWTRGGHGQGGRPLSGRALAVVRKAIGGIAQASLAAAAALPVLYEPCIRGRSRELDRRYDNLVQTLRRCVSATARPTRRPVYVDVTPRRRGS